MGLRVQVGKESAKGAPVLRTQVETVVALVSHGLGRCRGRGGSCCRCGGLWSFASHLNWISGASRVTFFDDVFVDFISVIDNSVQIIITGVSVTCFSSPPKCLDTLVNNTTRIFSLLVSNKTSKLFISTSQAVIVRTTVEIDIVEFILINNFQLSKLIFVSYAVLIAITRILPAGLLRAQDL